MSETTKRALNADLIDLSIPWHKRIDQTHLIAAPVANTPPRPSTFASDGGAERETTNSPAEIGTACTGRKTALTRMAVCAFVVALILVDIWVIGGAWSVLGAVCLVVWVNMLRREFASGGEGV